MIKTFKLKALPRTRRNLLAFLIIIIILAFILSFAKPARAASKLLKGIGMEVNTESIQDIATAVTLITLGVTMMLIATTFIAVPFVGVGLVVVGALIAGFGAWKLWRSNRKNKPDDGGDLTQD